MEPTWETEFERCRAWIEDALEYSGGLYALEDVREGIANGKYQLWPGKQSMCVTELCRYPQAAAVNVFLGGGDLTELLEMAPHILGWAKANGAEVATIYGRPGWARVFKGIGAVPLWTVSVARL
jgi:hypothetical protein